MANGVEKKEKPYIIGTVSGTSSASGTLLSDMDADTYFVLGAVTNVNAIGCVTIIDTSRNLIGFKCIQVDSATIRPYAGAVTVTYAAIRL